MKRRHFLSLPMLLPLQSAAARPLRMVVVDLMPWAGYDAANRLHGASVDMAALLAAQSGQPIVTSAVPYARAIAMLLGGGADLMLAIDTGERRLPPPLANVGSEQLLLLGARGTRYVSQQALAGRKVGLLRPSHFSLLLNTDIVRYETSSYEQGLRMLMQGRLDAVAGVRSTMDYAMHRLGLKQEDLGTPLVIGEADISLFLAPQAATPAVATSLQQACAQLQRKKTMPALLSQYRQAN